MIFWSFMENKLIFKNYVLLHQKLSDHPVLSKTFICTSGCNFGVQCTENFSYNNINGIEHSLKYFKQKK